jgi:glycosyltransferase involved in cell wall biosynthesis
MSKPIVLFIHQGGELYGSDRVFAQIIRYAAEVVEPIVLLSSEGPLRSWLEPYCREIYVHELGVLRSRHFTPRGSLLTLFQAIRACFFIVVLAKRNKVTGIYTNTIGILASGLAAQFIGKPHLWHIHEIVVTPKFLSFFLSWYVLKFSSHVVCNSLSTQRNLLRGWKNKEEKSRVIYNSIDCYHFDTKGLRERARVAFHLNHENVLVGVVGRVQIRKGQDDFLEAALLLKSEHPRVFFAIIGGVYDKRHDRWILKLKETAEKSKIADRFFFRDFNEKTGEIYAALDVVVVPSKFPESFGLVTLEAMAAGKPVVGTALGGTIEIIEDGVTGFLVPPNNPQALADKIELLIRDPELRRRMGEAGRARASEKFSEQHFGEEIQQLLSETFINN